MSIKLQFVGLFTSFSDSNIRLHLHNAENFFRLGVMSSESRYHGSESRSNVKVFNSSLWVFFFSFSSLFFACFLWIRRKQLENTDFLMVIYLSCNSSHSLAITLTQPL